MEQNNRNHANPHEHDHGSTGVMDDATAEWYVKNYGEDPTNRKTIELAELEQSDVVLDIGCGSGTAVREAAARLEDGRVTGVDPSPAMIRIAKEQTEGYEYQERIDFLDGFAENLPLPDQSMTVALAINSLHHWEDVDKGLSEARRVLRTDGRFFMTEEEVEKGKFGHGHGPLSDPDFVVRTIEDAGFVDVEVSNHIDGKVRMFLITARRPIG